MAKKTKALGLAGTGTEEMKFSTLNFQPACRQAGAQCLMKVTELQTPDSELQISYSEL